MKIGAFDCYEFFHSIDTYRSRNLSLFWEFFASGTKSRVLSEIWAIFYVMKIWFEIN